MLITSYVDVTLTSIWRLFKAYNDQYWINQVHCWSVLTSVFWTLLSARSIVACFLMLKSRKAIDFMSKTRFVNLLSVLLTESTLSIVSSCFYCYYEQVSGCQTPLFKKGIEYQQLLSAWIYLSNDLFATIIVKGNLFVHKCLYFNVTSR